EYDEEVAVLRGVDLHDALKKIITAWIPKPEEQQSEVAPGKGKEKLKNTEVNPGNDESSLDEG
ncbi:MAG TPA: hypothetical protein IAB92_07840, partial [Candidatus Faecousia faecigallinarum]|nr:hypothetical protein [Candidatus Faecousia faecigallinarum]